MKQLTLKPGNSSSGNHIRFTKTLLEMPSDIIMNFEEGNKLQKHLAFSDSLQIL